MQSVKNKSAVSSQSISGFATLQPLSLTNITYPQPITSTHNKPISQTTKTKNLNQKLLKRLILLINLLKIPCLLIVYF